VLVHVASVHTFHNCCGANHVMSFCITVADPGFHLREGGGGGLCQRGRGWEKIIKSVNG